jgi:hypothetical protein
MLSWWRLATLGALLATLAGCESVHIKDAYISRDSAGVRRTNCIRPNWMHYFLIIELISFKDDTLLWPYLRCDRGDCLDVFGAAPGDVIAPPFGDGPEDLVEFGNFAPGKTDGELKLELAEWEFDPETGQRKERPLTGGEYRWDIYLDDEEEPRESVPLVISPECKCIGDAVGCS